MQTTRLGLLFFGCLLSLAACAIAPLELEEEDTRYEASWEINPGREEASATEHEPPARRDGRPVATKNLRPGGAVLVTGPTPDPWDEASPSVDHGAGPTPDPWQPKQPDGNKGSAEGSSPNGPSKN